MQPLSQPRVIELSRDIPCAECGYNLRGLAPQGRCPECGQDVCVSLAERVAPDAGAVVPDPRWRRQMVESLVLSLVGLVLGMGTMVNWPAGWEWSRRGPNVPVVLVSTWWVLQWYSAMKLPRRDSAAPSSSRLEALEVWGLRLFSTVYLVLPALREVRLPVA